MGNILDCGVAQPPQSEEMKDTTIGTGVPGKCIVQESTPFADSLLWNLQRMYYEENNINAFASSSVPIFNTSNAYIAKVYADIILKFLLDWFDSEDCDLSQPVYILEPGAGHGKLGYLILKRLVELKEFWPSKASKPFVYLLSDFTEPTIKWWNTIGHFDQYKKDGIVDFVVFDCEKDHSLHLELANITLSKNDLKNPLIVLSNALFSCLKHDSFLFENNQVYRGMLTLSTNEMESLPAKWNILPKLQYTWNYQLVNNCDTLYNNEDINGLLRYYKQRMNDVILPLPIGAIECLQSLCDLSNNRVLFLISDKGTTEMDHYSKKDLFIFQNGGIHLSVNFHCLDLFTRNRGGELYSSPFSEEFRTCIYSFGMNKYSFPRFKWAVQRNLSSFTPETFNSLQKHMKSESSPSGKSAIALLRLSCFDETVFVNHKQILIDRGISSASSKEDLLRDIQKILDTYYPLQKNKDICFEIGRLYMVLKDYERAIRSFKLSNKYCNEHHVTYHNIGMCYEQLHLYLDARDAFQKALSIKPTYRESKIMLNKLTPLLEHATIKDEHREEEQF